MKIVGLTGGIGSGKTTVAKYFSELGAPVYIADTEAKKLTNTSRVIRNELIRLLGEQAYEGKNINRAFVAKKIFGDAELLAKVNAVIHPRVSAHFNKWILKQQGSYCIKEAAILFENGGYKNCDLTILVVAPLKDRISRVMLRDKCSKAEVKLRMAHQWSDAKKRKLADIVIQNGNFDSTKKQVNFIHASLIK